MKVFAQHCAAKPCDPGEAVRALRARLHAEEVSELINALGFGVEINVWDPRPKDLHSVEIIGLWREPQPFDLIEVADGCADLRVVTIGTELACGIDGDAVFAEVHRSNMAKGDGPMRADGKRLKPPGWKPPDVLGVLAKQLRCVDCGSRAGEDHAENQPHREPRRYT
jgi:predicted HAD superfamily Cof-like phosphohydrolase